MRRANRIILLILLILAAAGIVAYGGLSAMLSRIATREVSKFLAQLPEGEASCGEISFNLLTGTAHVNDFKGIIHNGYPAIIIFPRKIPSQKLA